MSNGTETVDDIIVAAAEARQGLTTLEHQLQGDIDEIDLRAFREERRLTEAERGRRRTLRAAQAEVRDAFASLAYVTARRLDNSEETARLLGRVRDINAGLGDDLDELKTIERYATIAAKVADGIAVVAAKLAAKMI